MQYLLTQKELGELKDKAEKMDEEARKTIISLCQDLAAAKNWGGYGKPLGCVHVIENDNAFGYCSGCPAYARCPQQKLLGK